MTLDKFLQDAAQFNPYCCLDIKEQDFLFRFAFGSSIFKSSNKRCNELRMRVAEKSGSSIRFEELDTDIEICFPIQIVVFVNRKVSFGHKLIQN